MANTPNMNDLTKVLPPNTLGPSHSVRLRLVSKSLYLLHLRVQLMIKHAIELGVLLIDLNVNSLRLREQCLGILLVLLLLICLHATR